MEMNGFLVLGSLCSLKRVLDRRIWFSQWLFSAWRRVVFLKQTALSTDEDWGKTHYSSVWITQLYNHVARSRVIVDISSILLHFRIYHKTLILKKISTLSFLRSKDCSSLLISGRQRILHSAAQVQSSVHKYSLTSYYVSGIKTDNSSLSSKCGDSTLVECSTEKKKWCGGHTDIWGGLTEKIFKKRFWEQWFSNCGFGLSWWGELNDPFIGIDS